MTAHGVSGLKKDEYYSRAVIGELTESNALIDYLTRRTREGSIASAILREDTNLAPPDVILVGDRPRNIDLAAQFCAENTENPVPVFVKEKDAPDPKRAYRCHGWFVVSHWVTSPEARRRWSVLSNRDNLTRVIFLKEVDCESPSR